MASMFEREESGFTEDYDPNAEPGEIAGRARRDRRGRRGSLRLTAPKLA